MRIIDISQPIHSDMAVYPGDPHFKSANGGFNPAALNSLAARYHYFLSALPLSVKGGDGAPCRAVLIEE